MSVRTRASTTMTNVDSLKKALTDAGFTYEEAKPGQVLTTSRSYGAGGDRVDIRLTGYTNSSHSGDLRAIGFKKMQNGTFEAVGDFWHLHDVNGKPLRNAEGLKKIVNGRYNYHQAVSAVAAKGFTITANRAGVVGKDGKIHMIATLTNPLKAGLQGAGIGGGI